MSMPTKRKPYCHPHLPYYAKGMCRNCYEKDLRKRNPEFVERQRKNTSKWVENHKKQKALLDAKYQLRPDSKERKSLRKRKRMLASFGLSLDDADRLLEIQEYRCAICGATAQNENNKKFLEFDHDHETNKPRGFLCQKCNKGIGLLGDCVEGIESAFKYLQNPPFKLLKERIKPSKKSQ